MFDFAWSEIALIGVVALVAIGPKDLPVAMKAVAGMVKKARRMAGEFQGHVDEMMRDANLSDVRSQINEIRNFDIKGTLARAIDEDGSLRRTINEDPLRDSFSPTVPGFAGLGADPTPATAAPEPPVTPAAPTIEPASLASSDAPSFIPPSIAAPPPMPAFIPPGTRRIAA